MADAAPARPALAGRVSIVLVAAVALVAAGLLYRTQSNAAEIRSKTKRIATSAEGINAYTDAILKLDETNRLAASILASVQPIGAPLKDIERQSTDIAAYMRQIRTSTGWIDDSATSIDGSAASIRAGVREIGSGADAIAARLTGVNADAAWILAGLRLLETGVRVVGDDLGATSKVIAAILADARGIDRQTVRTEHLASCIDNGLNGGQACRGKG